MNIDRRIRLARTTAATYCAMCVGMIVQSLQYTYPDSANVIVLVGVIVCLLISLLYSE